MKALGLSAWKQCISTSITVHEAFITSLHHGNSMTKSTSGLLGSNKCRLLSAHASSQSSDVSMKTVDVKSSVSKATKAYLQKISEHDKFIKEQVNKYEISKRHLANMMGENPETFTQADIDSAVVYLFPSGLHEPKARPAMKHPSELFTQKKEAEFDETGRPHSTFFYTGKTSYFTLFHEIAMKARKLDELQLQHKGDFPEPQSYEDSQWLSKEDLELMLLEPLNDKLFSQFIVSMDRFKNHAMAHLELDFIMKFRKKFSRDVQIAEIPPLMYTKDEMPYMTARGIRKKAKASVKVFGHGSGKININGEDILYFKWRQDRHQVCFPLQFTGLMRTVDVEATVEGGGSSGQSGAIRYAIAVALRSFVSEDMVEKMRIAGLLTRNPRKKERQKPGKRRARRGMAWRKR